MRLPTRRLLAIVAAALSFLPYDRRSKILGFVPLLGVAAVKAANSPRRSPAPDII